MAIRIKVIITEVDFVTILTKTLDLIMDLLTDATDLRKTVINKEQNLHINIICGKII